MGAVYLYHDLFGFILEMSPDVLDFLDAFAEPSAPAAVCERWAGRFDDADPRGFVEVFLQFHCLVEPGVDEMAEVWDYVPVRGRWNVWRREDDGGLTLFAAWGERPLTRHRLSPDEARLFESFDGERSLRARLDDGYQPSDVEALIARLVHHDVQAVKLSPVPMSTYRGRPDLQPPYLTSTMPYAPYDGDPRGVHDGAGSVSPADYYRREVIDADGQFDHQETTLAHLLRRPHPALGDRTYGEALVDALADRGMLPAGGVRVLEVGGGLGFVAEAMCGALAARGLEVEYHIVELSPTLAAAQRTRCGELPVTVREGDILTIDLREGGYDLIVANEMIGDLPAVRLSREQVGLDGDPAARAAALAELGDVGRLIADSAVRLDDAPDPFYFTWGAVRLVERAAAALAPGGVLFASEFGDLGRYPRLSTHLDHPELSIHFGLLAEAAAGFGLDGEVEFIIDLLDVDRSLQGLATTRSYFRALTAMLAEHGVELEKIGYTRRMFHDLVAGAVDLTRVGELHFDRLEDRLMGLVPHEFKALLARTP